MLFTDRNSLIARFVLILVLLGGIFGALLSVPAYAAPLGIAKKHHSGTNYFSPKLPAAPSNGLYLSLERDQTLGGITASDEDILRFDGTNWSMIFDGSDVGVGDVDLVAFLLFDILDTDFILMSFDDAVTVNGLTILPQDIVYFHITSLGTNTAGTFSMLFDGSKFGLDTSAEKIDAISLSPNKRFLISTTGDLSVPGMTGHDEDVLLFEPHFMDDNGEFIDGTWAMYFDGSDVGLGNNGEDIDALDVVGNTLYLSTEGKFKVNGVSGADEDIFVCEATAVGDMTACNYSPELYFDGSMWQLSKNNVDAFNFAVSGPIPSPTPYPVFLTPSLIVPTGTPTQTSTPRP